MQRKKKVGNLQVDITLVLGWRMYAESHVVWLYGMVCIYIIYIYTYIHMYCYIYLYSELQIDINVI